MKKRELPPQDILLKLLRYDPESGHLYWRERTPDDFKPGCITPEQACAGWNRRRAGRRAFTADCGTGYYQGSIAHRNFYAHRIIWRLMTGDDPEAIDHINGDRGDNRFFNLRAVSKAENALNSALDHRNVSGCPGVRWIPRIERWAARVTLKGEIHLLGHFVNLDDAIRARKTAERKLGFHPNHGRGRAQSTVGGVGK